MLLNANNRILLSLGYHFVKFVWDKIRLTLF